MAKFIIVVMDSVGIGALPDAHLFGDEGSDTLGHIIEAYPDIRLDNLGRLGLCLLKDLPCSTGIIGAYGRAAERFPGKDTTGGHFEIAGLVLDKPFPTFPDGFPKDFMEAFEAAIGRKTIGNYPASGTEIIQKLGDEHVKTGSPIVYTSADSVFQIAMHEDVIPLEEQYEICRKAREMLTGPLAVGRVICRPFTGASGNYTRTKNRRDYSFEPPGETILTAAKDAGLQVAGVGKIEDIFAGVGLTQECVELFDKRGHRGLFVHRLVGQRAELAAVVVVAPAAGPETDRPPVDETHPPVGVRQGELGLQLARQPHVVLVEEGQPLAPRLGDRGVARPAQRRAVDVADV